MEMLVTQGLNELKLLDSRINRKISELEFISCSKKSSKNINGKITKTEFIEKSNSDYESISDLIKNRNKIKSAIALSNAKTTVRIFDTDYTVAEAIERKNSISYEQNFLRALETQYTKAVDKVNKENLKVDESINQLLLTAYGKDSRDKVTTEMFDIIAKPYLEANMYELVEPTNTLYVINKLKENIESFLSEVDTALQVSNCTTVITI